MRLSPAKKSSGFTLLEIVVVLLVLGIVSTVVVSRYINANADARDAALMGKIRSHLRYARNASMNSDATWWINFNASSYTLNKLDAAGTSTTAVFPGEGSQTVSFPSGFSGPSISVYFDDWGRPTDSTGTQVSGFSLSFSGKTININSNGYIQ